MKLEVVSLLCCSCSPTMFILLHLSLSLFKIHSGSPLHFGCSPKSFVWFTRSPVNQHTSNSPDSLIRLSPFYSLCSCYLGIVSTSKLFFLNAYCSCNYLFKNCSTGAVPVAQSLSLRTPLQRPGVAGSDPRCGPSTTGQTTLWQLPHKIEEDWHRCQLRANLPHTHTKTNNKTLQHNINVNLPLVILHYSFAKCYYWEDLGKVYTESLFIIFYHYMCIYSFLRKTSNLKLRRKNPEPSLCRHHKSGTASILLIVIYSLLGPVSQKRCNSINICLMKSIHKYRHPSIQSQLVPEMIQLRSDSKELHLLQKPFFSRHRFLIVQIHSLIHSFQISARSSDGPEMSW